MRIIFFRHGNSARKGRNQSDGKRLLTLEGKIKVRKTCRGLRHLKISPEVILTSPYLRSSQTAKILALELGVKKDVVNCDALKPGGTLTGFLEQVKQLDGTKELLVVGHEPGLSEIISELLLGIPTLKIQLKKAGTCCVEIENVPIRKSGRLLWLLTPKQLRKIK